VLWHITILIRKAEASRSVVSQFLLRTFWPTILSCDTAAERKHGVRGRVVFLQYIALAAVAITAIAAVLAPIGLGESIVEGPIVNATFAYAHDPTVFGIGTALRDNYTISRSCANETLPCPGLSPKDFVQSTDSSRGLVPDIFVPENITRCFSSGTTKQGDFRPNPFQVQYQQYETALTQNHTLSKANTTGSFVLLDSVFLLDDFEVREGVVIDAIKGGVGFRNHTVPVAPVLVHGGVWTELLLWLEPESACVDTNWTIEFGNQLSPFSTDPNADYTDLVLVNRGEVGDPAKYITIPPFATASHPTSLLVDSRAFLTARNFRARLDTLLRTNPAHQNYSQEVPLDPEKDFWLSWVLPMFELTSGLFLGSIDDHGNTPNQQPSQPEIVYLDPTQFNLTAFNTTEFFATLDSLEGGYSGLPPDPTANGSALAANETFPGICKTIISNTVFPSSLIHIYSAGMSRV
jgi:hypothetical protein